MAGPQWAGVSWTTLDSPYPSPTSLSYFLHDIWGENPPSLVGRDTSLEKGPKYIRSDQEGLGGISFQAAGTQTGVRRARPGEFQLWLMLPW